MLHHLLVGTWTPPGAIFTFEFDDEKLTLKLIKRTAIPEDEPISWMTLDHKRRTLYGAAMKKYSSFTINSPTSITHDASFPMTHHPEASSKDTKTRAIFILAAHLPPYAVYGAPFYNFASHGNAFSVSESGAMKAELQNFPYNDKAAVHGMVFDAREEYLYSADMWDNRIWVHRKAYLSSSSSEAGDAKDGENQRKRDDDGKLELVGSVAAPSPSDHPRWVEIAPSDKYLYVLMESGNRLCEYTIDPSSHMPEYTGREFPLIPPGHGELFPRMYRSDVVFRSCSGKYLFATSRSNDPSLTGYIAAFSLSTSSSDAGRIERQICLNPTPTSGGHSNAVSPCPWSDEWLALTDDEVGFIEMYRWKDEFLGRVARCEVREPGFGMNAVWVD